MKKRPLDHLTQDVRYALRTLRRSPGYTLTSIVVLALAIGANTAMFSVLNAVLLRPLPFKAPEQLAMLWTEIPSQGAREGRSAYWNFEQWQAQSESFADMAVFDPASVTLTGGERARQVSLTRVSPNFFSLLGVQPVRGRVFSAKEAADRQRLALISHTFWQNHFASSTDAIGSTIHVDGAPSKVIGILPATFLFSQSDVWEPHTLVPNWEAERRNRGVGAWFVIGRLHAGRTIEQAQNEMNRIAAQLLAQLSAAEQSRGVSVVPLSVQVTGRDARLILWMLAGAVFCVLLIAATNVASLSLARSISREREMAIRASLGAGRLRVIGQLLTESTVLAIAAASLGLLLADQGVRLINVLKPAALSSLNVIEMNAHVLGFATGLCLVTAILVGLAPALTMSRKNPGAGIQERGRSVSAGVTAGRIRRALVATEFALAIMLLAGAGLLVRSLWSAENVDPGFRTDRILTLQIAAPKLPTATQQAEFLQSVLKQIETLPGVESASAIGNFFIGGNPDRSVTVDGASQNVSTILRFRSDEISSAFFKTIGAPLLRGRLFSAADDLKSPPVAIVNEAMAARLWPGGDPVGKRFKIGPADSQAPWFTVVGLVRDMRRQGLEVAPIPQMFEAAAQNPSRLSTLLVRTSLQDPLSLTSAVEAAVHRVDKRAPLYAIDTLENKLGSLLTARRFQTSLLLAFATVALLMAAIGIYGLVQYSITTRTYEIGIRMAVGAQAGQIFRMVLLEGLILSLSGLAIGLAGALLLGRLISSLLYGVTASDPLTFIAVSALLTIVALAACYLPALRAAKVQPLSALRQQ